VRSQITEKQQKPSTRILIPINPSYVGAEGLSAPSCSGRLLSPSNIPRRVHGPRASALSGTPLGWAAATGDADMLEVMIKQAGRGGLDTPDIHGFGIS